jgi:predicted TIM-barrel fold metal-dependent hydrolase
MSVHPYRADALGALARWHAAGMRMVKWLPNAQGIDPADPQLEAYYRMLVALDLTLLTHVGEERAVEAKAHQKFGNPLRFRFPLGLGVRIVMAHCANLGTVEDLDAKAGARIPAWQAFMRLMDEPAYEGRLFGEISAMTQYNRLP